MKLLSLIWVVLVAACVGAGLYFAHDACPPAFWATAKVAPFGLLVAVLFFLTVFAIERLLRK